MRGLGWGGDGARFLKPFEPYLIFSYLLVGVFFIIFNLISLGHHRSPRLDYL